MELHPLVFLTDEAFDFTVFQSRTYGAQALAIPLTPRAEIRANITGYGGGRANRVFGEINVTDTNAHNLLPGQGTGIYADLIMAVFANTSATGTELTLSDGTNSIPLYIPAGVTFGFVCPPNFTATSSNTAWTVQCVTGVTTLKASALFQLNRA